MSKTVKLELFVYERRFFPEEAADYVVFNSDRMGDAHYSLIGPASIEYVVPDTFNATASKIAALEAKRDEVRAQFSATIAELNASISKLQAIEYTPEAA